MEAASEVEVRAKQIADARQASEDSQAPDTEGIKEYFLQRAARKAREQLGEGEEAEKGGSVEWAAEEWEQAGQRRRAAHANGVLAAAAADAAAPLLASPDLRVILFSFSNEILQNTRSFDLMPALHPCVGSVSSICARQMSVWLTLSTAFSSSHHHDDGSPCGDQQNPGQRSGVFERIT